MRQILLNLAIAISAIFAPAKGMILTSLLLIAIDLLTGVIAARKQGIPITSAGLQRTVVKCFLYESAILLAFLTETYLLDHSMPIMNMIAGLVGITELKSCLENMDVIGGGGVLKSIIEKLGSKNQV